MFLLTYRKKELKIGKCGKIIGKPENPEFGIFTRLLINF